MPPSTVDAVNDEQARTQRPSGGRLPLRGGSAAGPCWRWEWQEDAVPMICLVSETVHPSTRQGIEEDGTAKICLEYFDEQLISAFID